MIKEENRKIPNIKNKDQSVNLTKLSNTTYRIHSEVCDFKSLYIVTDGNNEVLDVAVYQPQYHIKNIIKPIIGIVKIRMITEINESGGLLALLGDVSFSYGT